MCDVEDVFNEDTMCKDCNKRFYDTVNEFRQKYSSCEFCLKKSIENIKSKNNYPLHF